MSQPIPHYELTRVLEAGPDGPPEIIPVEKPAGPVDRRTALGTGLGAAAALWLLNGCKTPPKYQNIPVPPGKDKISYSAWDRRTRRYITYTMPCGSPLPAGAVCTCNCVPTYKPEPVRRPKVHTHNTCTCNKVCTCVPVYY